MLNWTSPSERGPRLVPGADDLYVHIQPGLMRRQDTGLHDTDLYHTGKLGDAA